MVRNVFKTAICQHPPVPNHIPSLLHCRAGGLRCEAIRKYDAIAAATLRHLGTGHVRIHYCHVNGDRLAYARQKETSMATPPPPPSL
jgi:hypothetical protein